MHVLEPGMWAVDAKRRARRPRDQGRWRRGQRRRGQGLVEPGRLEGTFGGPTRRGE